MQTLTHNDLELESEGENQVLFVTSSSPFVQRPRVPAPVTFVFQFPESPSPRVPEFSSPRVPESPSPRVPESPCPRVPESPSPRAPESSACQLSSQTSGSPSSHFPAPVTAGDWDELFNNKYGGSYIVSYNLVHKVNCKLSI